MATAHQKLLHPSFMVCDWDHVAVVSLHVVPGPILYHRTHFLREFYQTAPAQQMNRCMRQKMFTLLAPDWRTLVLHGKVATARALKAPHSGCKQHLRAITHILHSQQPHQQLNTPNSSCQHSCNVKDATMVHIKIVPGVPQVVQPRFQSRCCNALISENRNLQHDRVGLSLTSTHKLQIDSDQPSAAKLR